MVFLFTFSSIDLSPPLLSSSVSIDLSPPLLSSSATSESISMCLFASLRYCGPYFTLDDFMFSQKMLEGRRISMNFSQNSIWKTRVLVFWHSVDKGLGHLFESLARNPKQLKRLQNVLIVFLALLYYVS